MPRSFAYVADGAEGLKVIQLFSPESQPGFYGFSPDPKPELIAWRKTTASGLGLVKGLDRADRAVDETGNQMRRLRPARLYAKPFTLPEMQKLYLDASGAALAGDRPGCSRSISCRRPRHRSSVVPGRCCAAPDRRDRAIRKRRPLGLPDAMNRRHLSERG